MRSRRNDDSRSKSYSFWLVWVQFGGKENLAVSLFPSSIAVNQYHPNKAGNSFLNTVPYWWQCILYHIDRERHVEKNVKLVVSSLDNVNEAWVQGEIWILTIIGTEKHMGYLSASFMMHYLMSQRMIGKCTLFTRMVTNIMYPLNHLIRPHIWREVVTKY
jgi:hypothetical protein